MSIQPGDRRGRLIVIEQLPKLPDQKHYAKRWKVRCDCGVEKAVFQPALRTQKSCGCLRDEKARETMKVNRLSPNNRGNLKHGLAKTRTWAIWCDMRRRCTQPTANAYARYGGRGIKVCDAWADYAEFYIDMGECPPNGTLDRIDNDGGYAPENCRWATRKEQANNRSSNRKLNAFGRVMTIAEWSDETGIRHGTICARLDKYGWTAEQAVTL